MNTSTPGAADADGSAVETGLMEEITPGWQFVSIGFEGNPVDISGIDVWDAEWTAVERSPITVAHPSYPRQRHSMNVYEIRAVSPAVVFAAGEFSNGVWGFFMPTRKSGEEPHSR
jgi:hypothetical protein